MNYRLVLLFLALILLVGTGVFVYKETLKAPLESFLSSFAYKYKFSTPPVYKHVGEIKNYVDPEKIIENIKPESVQIQPTPKKALLAGAKWVPQTFNNCVPATVSMVLQYFGFSIDQNTLKAALRTNSDDKNVFTYEIRDYLKQNYNIESKLLYNGDRERLKSLIANGFYVVIEDFLKPNDDIGHVTILRGFDDEEGVFIADDSYLGVNIVYKYEGFEENQWKPFNREYLPVYRKEQQPLLEEILGEDLDERKMFEKAVLVNQTDVEKNPKDMYAFFNLGTSFFGLGKFPEAKAAFEKSKSLGWPKRMLWYQIQPIQTYNKLGEYQKAIELANLSLVGNDSFAEAHVEKAISYKGLGDKAKAKYEAKRALFYSPNLKLAKDYVTAF